MSKAKESRKKLDKASPQKAGAKQVGRPPGKRTNPEYGQFSLWLRKDIQRLVKAQLVLDGIEFSELVQSLLEQWLHKRQMRVGG